jgi:hypothetical protein
VASLPQEERTQPASTPLGHRHYLEHPGPGALLIWMLGNRNLRLANIAVLFLVGTGRYWSASTYGMVGKGREHVTSIAEAMLGGQYT